MFKEFLRNNSPALVVLAVGTAVSFVIGMAITGNVHDAVGFAHRR